MLSQHKSHHRLIFAAGAATAAWLGMRHLIRKHEASADPGASSDQQDETAHR